MKTLIAMILLAFPSGAAQTSEKAEPEQTQWLVHRIEALRLSDDARERVWGKDQKSGKQLELAWTIASDHHLLRRYAFELERALKAYGHVNPLDQELAKRVWFCLAMLQDDVAAFESAARHAGVTRPKPERAKWTDALRTARPPKPGDKRYNPDSGDYEVYDSSGGWK